MAPDRFQCGGFRRSLAPHCGEEFAKKGGIRPSVATSDCVEGNGALATALVIVHDRVLFEIVETGNEGAGRAIDTGLTAFAI